MKLDETAPVMFAKKIKERLVINHNKIVGLLSLTHIAPFQPHIIRVLKALSAKQEKSKDKRISINPRAG